MKIAIIGGGAAGFFAALAAKEARPETEVTLFEGSAQLLSKVRISGGGRCNVTHGCFDPKILVKNYPRGSKELLGPFHRFQPLDTIEWFKARGVILKEERDGRIFPLSDSSETIITCFLKEAERLGIVIHTRSKLERMEKRGEGFTLYFREGASFFCDRLIFATGSSREIWDSLKSLGHTIESPVPSLFTFNIPSFSLVTFSGLSHHVKIKLEGSKLEQEGSLLITHWGFSGPAVLKLSAIAARYLAEREYKATLLVDWLPQSTEGELLQFLESEKQNQPAKHLGSVRIFSLPKSLWRGIGERLSISPDLPLRTLSKVTLGKLCRVLKSDSYQISGKTTNKEEFVTCGGVVLSEISFKKMESNLCKGLFFCGEILDIDGVTGGFNFQNAWTTGWIAGRAAVE